MRENLIDINSTIKNGYSNLYFVSSLEPSNELFKKYRELIKKHLPEKEYWVDSISGSEVAVFDYYGINVKFVNNYDDAQATYFTSPYDLEDFLDELGILVEQKFVMK